MNTTTDSITKSTTIAAPIQRVWDAISDARAFGTWFGIAFDGPFVVGQWVTGRIVPTSMDAEVAALQAPHAGTPLSMLVEAVEPLRRFAFRWHPYPVDESARDQAASTLVTFDLETTGDEVRLTITESGFDAVPLAHRAAAFSSNEGGWTHQIRLVSAYVASRATT